MNRQTIVSAAILTLIFIIGVIGLGSFGSALLALLALGAIGATFIGDDESDQLLPTTIGIVSVWAAGYMMIISGSPTWGQTCVLGLAVALYLASVQARDHEMNYISQIAGTLVLVILTGIFIGQKYPLQINQLLESADAPQNWKLATSATELKEGSWEIVTPNSGKAGLPVSVNVKSKKMARITYEWSSSGTSGRTVMKARVSSEDLTGDFRTSSAGSVSGGSGQFQLEKDSPGCFRGTFTSNGRKANVALRQAGKTHCQR